MQPKHTKREHNMGTLYLFKKAILNQKVVMGLIAKKENDFDNLNLHMTELFLIPMLKTKQLKKHSSTKK